MGYSPSLLLYSHSICLPSSFSFPTRFRSFNFYSQPTPFTLLFTTFSYTFHLLSSLCSFYDPMLLFHLFLFLLCLFRQSCLSLATFHLVHRQLAKKISDTPYLHSTLHKLKMWFFQSWVDRVLSNEVSEQCYDSFVCPESVSKSMRLGGESSSTHKLIVHNIPHIRLSKSVTCRPGYSFAFSRTLHWSPCCRGT